MGGEEEDANSQTFVIRIWVEQTAKETPSGTWRGHITHLLDNRRLYVESLEEILEFVASYIRKMGQQA